MKRMMILSLAASFSTTALAQTEDAPAPREVYKPVTEIEFGELDINGELVRPEIQLLSDVKRSPFIPLISLRTDFNTELAESVSEVK